MSQRLIVIVAALHCGLLAALPTFAEELVSPVEAPTPSLAVAPAEEETTDEPARISMELQGTKLSQVLRVFSQQAGINLIASVDVADRPITIYLEDVAVLDALDQILAAGHLRYERPPGSDIYTIKAAAEAAPSEPTAITRVYRLRYARVSKSLFARTASAMNELTPTEATSAASTNSSLTASLGAAGTGIDIILKELLTDQGKLVTDPRTNSLIITDVPSNFPKIEAALAALDVKTAQILVDTEVIETTLTKLKDLGVEWGTGTEGDMATFTMGSRTTRFPFNLFSEAIAPPAGTKFSTNTLSFASATAVLQALESDGESKVLARPKVITLDNESAMIRLTTNETVGFKTTTGELTATTQAEPERTMTGIILGVTPQINSDGYLTMVVVPSVTKTVASRISPPSGGATARDPRTRGTHTTVRIRNGDTLVIGGLIDRDETHSLRRVPILSGIPVLGEVFKNDERIESSSELIVFVTPRILGEPSESRVASAGQPATAREQESGSASRQDLIEQTLNRLEQPSL